MTDQTNHAAPKTIHLKDYKVPPWLVDTVELDIALDPARTVVATQLAVRRNPASTERASIHLDGEAQRLVSVAIDNRVLAPGEYELDAQSLTLRAPGDRCSVTIVSEIAPERNTALEGLYLSGDVLTTQCEAEGFRRITYYPDRPDVLSVYTVRISADRTRFPHLLSNGNCTERGALANGRHFAVWHDPFPKPCYLFALVAGQLDRLEDTFTTRSGRKVDLHLYVDPGNAGRGAFALDALKRAMKWDEDRFGLEYDLDVFQIVAVGAFNMGAMENKGLNIFNAKYILADALSATDADYQGIEAVVAHEYFHNWTGNRITCRDWFQLSLKEGLTVYRDQEFQADMRGRAITRIADVRTLRAQQFPEDAGPLAHAVRPESFVEINNFYTATIYEKGAEIIRMIETLIGREAFRKGMDLYVARHDGTAATVEDFVSAMEDASGRDLTQMRRWYVQAGTPELTATWDYDPRARQLDVTLSQRTPPTPGQPVKEPLLIPVALGLIDADGSDLPLHAEGDAADAQPLTGRVVELTEATQVYRFRDVPGSVTPSLLRGFSAPCLLKVEPRSLTQSLQMRFDSDPFNRWDSVQGFALAIIIELSIGQPAQGGIARLSEALESALASNELDPAFKALLLTLPTEREVAQSLEWIDIDAIHAARKTLLRAVATNLSGSLSQAYGAAAPGVPYAPTTEQMASRALRGAALRLLGSLESTDVIGHAERQFDASDNMTDTMAALSVLTDIDTPARARTLGAFYTRWKDTPLVVDKWLSLQAISTLPGTVEAVEALLDHDAFSLRNPNKVRALVGAFAHSNPYHFHRADGAGYRLVARTIAALDEINPQIAARLATAFDAWRRLDPRRQSLAREALDRLAARSGASANLTEMTARLLA